MPPFFKDGQALFQVARLAKGSSSLSAQCTWEYLASVIKSLKKWSRLATGRVPNGDESGAVNFSPTDVCNT